MLSPEQEARIRADLESWPAPSPDGHQVHEQNDPVEHCKPENEVDGLAGHNGASRRTGTHRGLA
jgi:hypothetical protein